MARKYLSKLDSGEKLRGIPPEKMKISDFAKGSNWWPKTLATLPGLRRLLAIFFYNLDIALEYNIMIDRQNKVEENILSA
jgi:hypothetical protein